MRKPPAETPPIYHYRAFAYPIIRYFNHPNQIYNPSNQLNNQQQYPYPQQPFYPYYGYNYPPWYPVPRPVLQPVQPKPQPEKPTTTTVVVTQAEQKKPEPVVEIQAAQSKIDTKEDEKKDIVSNQNSINQQPPTTARPPQQQQQQQPSSNQVQPLGNLVLIQQPQQQQLVDSGYQLVDLVDQQQQQQPGVMVPRPVDLSTQLDFLASQDLMPSQSVVQHYISSADPAIGVPKTLTVQDNGKNLETFDFRQLNNDNRNSNNNNNVQMVLLIFLWTYESNAFFYNWGKEETTKPPAETPPIYHYRAFAYPIIRYFNHPNQIYNPSNQLNNQQQYPYPQQPFYPYYGYNYPPWYPVPRPVLQPVQSKPQPEKPTTTTVVVTQAEQKKPEPVVEIQAAQSKIDTKEDEKKDIVSNQNSINQQPPTTARPPQQQQQQQPASNQVQPNQPLGNLILIQQPQQQQLVDSGYQLVDLVDQQQQQQPGVMVPRPVDLSTQLDFLASQDLMPSQSVVQHYISSADPAIGVPKTLAVQDNGKNLENFDFRQLNNDNRNSNNNNNVQMVPCMCPISVQEASKLAEVDMNVE
ncbi:mediator of RNA polymerase II transcription subunit 15-like [Ctenocephalides felis]|uniref:mediator of RNA polymerase II transcription subunit 15-like n=1 Tax=Ctenocephalides felis TaxID=7515 RepID=UPI000E6E2CA8|nr:mediator of RNA polymerase II transcription subunit 15-like [Ctenocephalides felis]